VNVVVVRGTRTDKTELAAASIIAAAMPIWVLVEARTADPNAHPSATMPASTVAAHTSAAEPV
jgi:hypothetical protein